MQAVVVADIGSAVTKAALLVTVAGELRVAGKSEVPTSTMAPRADVLQGLHDAILALQTTTGRHILGGDFVLSPPRIDGHGIDYLLATCSAGELPTLLTLVGDMDAPEAVAVRAELPPIMGVPIRYEHLAVNGQHPLLGTQLLRWQTAPVDAVLFVPPRRPNKELIPRVNELVQFLSSAARRRGVHRLPLYMLGSQQLLQSLGLVTSEEQAWQALAAQDGAMSASLSTLAAQVDQLYRDRQQRLVPRLQEVNHVLSAPLQTGVRSLGAAAFFLAESQGAKTLVVDVGATTTAAIVSDGRTVDWGVRAGMGTGSGASTIVDIAGAENIIRWLPYELAAASLEEAVLARTLFPWTVPGTIEDLQIDHALAIEAVRSAMALHQQADLQASVDTIVATGGLFRNAGNPGQVALTLTTAIQPTGRTLLLLDRYGILEPAAVLAEHEPAITRELLLRDGLETLGTCIGVGGKGKDGEAAVQVTVVDGPEAGRSFMVHVGSIDVLPVGPGDTVTLELQPQGRFNVGLQAGEAARADSVAGGTVGVIFDARLRPLSMPATRAEAITRLAQWMEVLHAY